jgi:hypothetical protein
MYSGFAGIVSRTVLISGAAWDIATDCSLTFDNLSEVRAEPS